MQAVRFYSFGAPSVLRVEDIADPKIGQDDVVIEIRAAAINPSDVKNVAGMMPHTPLPRTPGRDFAGVVADGPRDLIGLEVWGSGGELGFDRDGSHATRLLLPRAAVSEKPKNLTFDQASVVGVPFVTAWSALATAGGLAAGETAVVIGASGAVGSAAVQIAAWRGAHVIGAVRGDITGRSGDGIPLVNTENGFADAVKEATGGRGADLIFDAAVGGSLVQESLRALAPKGRLIEITVTGGRQVSFDLMDFYRRELRLLGVNTLFLSAADCAGILTALAPGFQTDALRPPAISARYALVDASRAYERVSADGSGKVLLVPE